MVRGWKAKGGMTIFKRRAKTKDYPTYRLGSTLNVYGTKMQLVKFVKCDCREACKGCKGRLSFNETDLTYCGYTTAGTKYF